MIYIMLFAMLILQILDKS